MNERQQGTPEAIAALQAELRRYKSAVTELELLNRIAVTAGTSADLDQTLNEILQQTLKAFNAEQGTILLTTGDPGRPFRTLLRQDDRSRLHHHYDILTAITGWALSHEEPLVISDLAADSRFSATPDEKMQIRSVLCAPIWFEGKIIGLITMLNKKAGESFSADDLPLLTTIGVQAGQLIKNADLRHDAVRRLQEAEHARWETEKLKDLDRVKSDLFTALAHELRTPLTLIIGPLEQLISGTPPDDPRQYYSLMRHQAERLLHRVNDLLALATIDAGVMKLNIARWNIGRILKRVIASFESAARTKGVLLEGNADLDHPAAWCDGEKIESILTNLVSNALKFTLSGGRVAVTTSPTVLPGTSTGAVGLVVVDSGIGIPAEEHGRIFERFQRNPSAPLTESTGIGLSLVRELVALHFGSIDVESAPQVGSRFTVRIPVDRNFYEGKGIRVHEKETGPSAVAAPAPGPLPMTAIPGPEDATRSILIVEDDDDLRGFIREILEGESRILEARNGDEGMAIAFEAMPDLIVSDVLMPGMDGLTLCTRLRLDERTSHIPVILLTSRAELESKLEGLEAGADDYIAKPFSPRELSVRIANLLEQRRLLRERYRREVTLEPKNVAITSADEGFLNRLLGSVEAHLADTQFGVEQLAHDAAMSKTHLNRKLKALTDQTPNEFIRTYRLKRAARMLLGRSGNVSEVAYNVGFSNPSYFAEVFREAFGCSPTEYGRRMADPTEPPA